MTSEELISVWETIELEGFDYTFDGYSSFSDIEDREFHRRRKAYKKAKKRLEKYLQKDYKAATNDP